MPPSSVHSSRQNNLIRIEKKRVTKMNTINKRILNAALGSVGVSAVVIALLFLAVEDDARPLAPTSVVEKAGAARPAAPLPAERRPAVDGRSERSAELANMERAQRGLLQKIERLESLIAEAGGDEESVEADELDSDVDKRGVPESPEAEEERMLAQIREQVHMLDTTLYAEVVDRKWAEPATIALREALEKELADTIDVLEADCRSTMCRLSLAVDPASLEESFRKLQEVIPWNGESFFQMDDVDSGEAVLYIAREDLSLPRATQEDVRG